MHRSEYILLKLLKYKTKKATIILLYYYCKLKNNWRTRHTVLLYCFFSGVEAANVCLKSKFSTFVGSQSPEATTVDEVEGWATGAEVTFTCDDSKILKEATAVGSIILVCGATDEWKVKDTETTITEPYSCRGIYYVRENYIFKGSNMFGKV